MAKHDTHLHLNLKWALIGCIILHRHMKILFCYDIIREAQLKHIVAYNNIKVPKRQQQAVKEYTLTLSKAITIHHVGMS